MSDFIERDEHIKGDDAYGNYLNRKNRKSYEELEKEFRKRDVRKYSSWNDCDLEDDDYEDEDYEDDDYEDDDSGASNKEIFSSVGVVFVPVLICCMLISLFSNPKGDKKNNVVVPLEAEESIEVNSESKDNSNFLEERKSNAKDILEKIKDDIMEDFDIDWSDLLIDH